jgi:hypothetical protein
MIIQAGDLGVKLERGTNTLGAILQRWLGEWRDNLVEGKPVAESVELEPLPHGVYRMAEAKIFLRQIELEAIISS